MVFLRTLSGATAVLDVQQTSTVADLKAAIERLEGIEAEEQRILFAGELISILLNPESAIWWPCHISLEDGPSLPLFTL